jgi:hypothetical protein
MPVDVIIASSVLRYAPRGQSWNWCRCQGKDSKSASASYRARLTVSLKELIDLEKNGDIRNIVYIKPAKIASLLGKGSGIKGIPLHANGKTCATLCGIQLKHRSFI